MTVLSSGARAHVVTRPTGTPGIGDRPMTSFHLVLAAGGALLLIGLIMVFWPVFWVGVGLVAASVVVGKIMQVMGMGTT